MGSPSQGSIDELAAHWRSRPDARVTIALCEALRTAPRGTLVEEVGARASRDYAADAAVLLAAARMYMAAQRLGDAQTVLVTAGKAAPRDAQVYRFLGEVLLRRGDAERAVRVLERAIHFGATDPETRLWSERANVFKSMQATAGMRAVANEIQRTAPLEAPRAPLESMADTTTEVNVVKAPPLGGPDDDDDDDELTRRPAPIHEGPAATTILSRLRPRIHLRDQEERGADVFDEHRERTYSRSHSAATTSRASPPSSRASQAPSKVRQGRRHGQPFAPIGAAPPAPPAPRRATRSR